jgi:AcrR family transcriptional regulator
MAQAKKTSRPAAAGAGGDAKSKLTRQRILDATAKVMSAKGYSAASVREIARVAKVQAPAIYYYFNSREELIAEVIWVGMSDVRAKVREALAGLPAETDPVDRLMTAVDVHLRWVLEASDYTMASIRNSGQMPRALTMRYRREAELHGAVWASLIDDIEEAGLLRPGTDTGAARMLVIGALNWAPEWWDSRRGGIEPVVATAKSIVRHGLVPD